MHTLRQLALIGPTASGKTDLALDIAEKYDGIILSLDSLALYKHTDIVSAKPKPHERRGIPHYGLDVIEPNEPFDVVLFAELYRDVARRCINENRPLIIVGGTSFYLKTLIEGISPKPSVTPEVMQEAQRRCRNITEAYETLYALDSAYMSRIDAHDSYRIQKAWEIYLASNMTPSAYFQVYPPLPVIKEKPPLYEIVWDRHALRKRIRLRTEAMLREGLIDEIASLERRYTRAPHCMKAIGIRETLDFLDGRLNKADLIEKITVNTGRLAKRQETFNRTQFQGVHRDELGALRKLLLETSHSPWS